MYELSLTRFGDSDVVAPSLNLLLRRLGLPVVSG